MKKFDNTQLKRYQSQIIIEQIGTKGQKKLFGAKVLIVGAGGLGSPCALYLAAAGCGTIGIVDCDKVELGNLQRQILYSESDIGKPKAESAGKRLMKLNHEIKIEPYNIRLSTDNIYKAIQKYDIVADCSDNFPTRYLVNDACVLHKKPFTHASVFQFSGQAITVYPGKSACYRCLYPEPPPPDVVADPSQAGILGAAAALGGVISANEILKFILGIGDLLTGKLLTFNTLDFSFKELRIHKDAGCMACAKG
ncbi:MAG: HesA/MoeB/ThiF family protein [Candidatus Omnitrophota bacterium]